MRFERQIVNRSKRSKNIRFMNFIHVVSFLGIPYHLLYPDITNYDLLILSQMPGIVLNILCIIITFLITTVWSEECY